MRAVVLAVTISGCALFTPSNAQRAKSAADIVDYAKALDQCRAEGKAAKSFAVYEACAKEADIRFGMKDGGP